MWIWRRRWVQGGIFALTLPPELLTSTGPLHQNHQMQHAVIGVLAAFPLATATDILRELGHFYPKDEIPNRRIFQKFMSRARARLVLLKSGCAIAVLAADAVNTGEIKLPDGALSNLGGTVSADELLRGEEAFARGCLAACAGAWA